MLSTDDEQLKKLGYSQQLFRGFNGFMSFAFCFTSVAVLSSLSVAWPSAMNAGGPAVLIWGWVICGVFTNIVGCAMGEVCSAYPSAGSVYHWTAMLAPEKSHRLAAYICGIFNFVGNVAGDAGFAFGFASVISSARLYGNGWDEFTKSCVTNSTGDCIVVDYTNNERVGIAIAVCVAWTLLNYLRVDQQGWFNSFAAVFHIASIVAIVVCVVSMTTKDPDVPTSWAWSTYYNGTGVDDKYMGYVLLIGLLQSLFAFSGYEAGAHMAEETRNAAVSSPWGLIATTACTAVVGFIYIVGVSFASTSTMPLSYAKWAATNTDDPDLSVGEYLWTAIDNVSSADSIAYVFFSACGSKTGLALTVLVIINLFFAGISSLTVTSRIAFALARDKAFPFSETFAYVTPGTKAPLGGVLLTLGCDILMILLGLVSSSAIFAILSVCVIGYQISYAIPILIRAFAGDAFPKDTQFSLGRAGPYVAGVGAFWLISTSTIFFWPPSLPVKVVGTTVDGEKVAITDDNFNCASCYRETAYARNVEPPSHNYPPPPPLHHRLHIRTRAIQTLHRDCRGRRGVLHRLRSVVVRAREARVRVTS